MKLTIRDAVQPKKEPVLEFWLETSTSGEILLRGRKDGGFAYTILHIGELGIRRRNGCEGLGLPVNVDTRVKDIS